MQPKMRNAMIDTRVSVCHGALLLRVAWPRFRAEVFPLHAAARRVLRRHSELPVRAHASAGGAGRATAPGQDWDFGRRDAR